MSQTNCADRCIPIACKPERKRRYSGCGVIDISPGVVKTWVHIKESSSATAGQLINIGKVSIELFRKGQPDSFVTYPAFSTDNNGNVSFYWDDKLLLRESGYYIGDVFVNGGYCFTIEFRIRGCEAVAVACQNEYEPVCGVGCEDAIGSSAPIGCVETPAIPQDTIQTVNGVQPHCGTPTICP